MERNNPVQPSLSPWKSGLLRLRKNRTAVAGAVILIILYLSALFAGFLSPYSPTADEFRNHFHHPPTKLHFRDEKGGFHIRPFVARTYLLDRRTLTYASAEPLRIIYRYPEGNKNPYFPDTLESEDALLTITNQQSELLAQTNQLIETAPDSGLFSALLPIEPGQIANAQELTSAIIDGPSVKIRLVPNPIVDPNLESEPIYSANTEGMPLNGYHPRSELYPLRFFVSGWRYKLFGVFETDLHFVGVDQPAHLFLFGTDQAGRDIFSRVLSGAKISLTVGLFGVLLTSAFGLIIGGIAGYYGGKIESLLMRFSEILLSIPALYLILTLRNAIPNRLQESYDRIRELSSQTFAWHSNLPAASAVVIIVLLLLSYYCYRARWSRRRVIISAAVLACLLAGNLAIQAGVSIAESIIPGSTYLSSEWTYLVIILILSTVGWAAMARVIRGMVLSLREEEYVMAAKAMGASDTRIIARHILPNTFGYVIVRGTLLIPAYILGEVALSFLGVGIQEPQPSWGNMLSTAQNIRVLQQFTWSLAPGFFLFITVLAYNFFGDGLRDAFDPKQE